LGQVGEKVSTGLGAGCGTGVQWLDWWSMRRLSLRERSFECVVIVDGREQAFHVRAWDAWGAEEQIRASLKESGISRAATIRVHDGRRVAPRPVS